MSLQESEVALRRAQKSELVGHLVCGLAHDFNNILTVILGYTDLILDELKPEDPLRADLEQVQLAGLRGSVLTRQLLAFSKRKTARPTVLDVGKVVSEMEGMLRRLLGEQIALSLITSFSTGKVLADPSEIEQIIMNLSINARDAMPDGGRLSVETADVELDTDYCAGHPDVTPGRYVMLAVTDTGSGMDAETLERISQPQAIREGTGLGVATILDIVQTMGGSLRAHSELGRGSTFKVYLPCTDRLASAPNLPPGNLRGTETILLVEDEEPVRAVTGAILRRQGYYVLEAQNGSEAVLLCEQLTSPLHLLITDLVMPRIGGLQLAEILHRMTPELRVLYVSGYDESAIAASRGSDDPMAFLPKPLTPAVLLARVREILDQAKDTGANL